MRKDRKNQCEEPHNNTHTVPLKGETDPRLHEIDNQYTHRSACSRLYFILQNQSPRSFWNSVICSSVILIQVSAKASTFPEPAGASEGQKAALQANTRLWSTLWCYISNSMGSLCFWWTGQGERKVVCCSDTGFKINRESRKWTIKHVGRHKIYIYIHTVTVYTFFNHFLYIYYIKYVPSLYHFEFIL